MNVLGSHIEELSCAEVLERTTALNGEFVKRNAVYSFIRHFGAVITSGIPHCESYCCEYHVHAAPASQFMLLMMESRQKIHPILLDIQNSI